MMHGVEKVDMENLSAPHLEQEVTQTNYSVVD